MADDKETKVSEIEKYLRQTMGLDPPAPQSPIMKAVRDFVAPEAFAGTKPAGVGKPRDTEAGPMERPTMPARQPDNTPPPVVAAKKSNSIEDIMPWKKVEPGGSFWKPAPVQSPVRGVGVGVVKPQPQSDAVKAIADRYNNPEVRKEDEYQAAAMNTTIGGRPASEIEGVVYSPMANYTPTPFYKSGIGKPMTEEEYSKYSALPPRGNVPGEAMTTPDVWSGPNYIPGTVSSPAEQKQAEAFSRAMRISRITKEIPQYGKTINPKTGEADYQMKGYRSVPDYEGQEKAFREADEVKAPKTVTGFQGSNRVTMQWDPETEQYVPIMSGPRSTKTGVGGGATKATQRQLQKDYRTEIRLLDKSVDRGTPEWAQGKKEIDSWYAPQFEANGIKMPKEVGEILPPVPKFSDEEIVKDMKRRGLLR